MKLDRLRMLRSEIATEFGRDISGFQVYYFFENRWNALDESTALSVFDVDCLSLANHEAVAYRASSQKTAWFSCPDANCSVSLVFPGSPQISKQKNARRRLGQAIQRADNAYKVAHNPLTFLLARDEFRTRLTKAIETLGVEQNGVLAVSEGDAKLNLVVFALDIDHFKQINDTYGHLYGDQVLKIFARRMEETARQITVANESKVSISLGHPSGEEFLVLLYGSLSQEDVIDWANMFRQQICDRSLPNDEDWDWLAGRDNIAAIVPPLLHERNVSCSIGVAFHTGANSRDLSADRVTRLLEQADTALYRAKAAGRNQVILFDSIMGSCGRVLEHDLPTGVVAIDIGKNVGVTVGQEFRVFPEGYAGKRNFVIRDGRTIRTLGVYPRVELTRITVFDVQPELGFGFVSNSEERGVDIVAGSHLEAIPLGSIGHVLPHAAKYLSSSVSGVKVGDISSLQEFLRESNKSGIKPFAVVFRFTKSDEYLKHYGGAALNSALAKLFRTLSASYSVACKVGVLDAASICVVGKPHAYDEANVKLLAERLVGEFLELGIVVGVFCDKDVEKKPSGSNSRLDILHAIEFARFSASDYAINSQAVLVHFSHNVAALILARQRESQSLKSAAADFDKLSSLGVLNGTILNLGALIQSGMGNAPRALELYRMAIEMEPEDIILRSNFGTAAARLNLIDDGLVVLNKLSDANVESLKAKHPYGYVTYAKLLAKAKIMKSTLFLPDRFRGMAAAALEIEGPDGSRDVLEIKRALE